MLNRGNKKEIETLFNIKNARNWLMVAFEGKGHAFEWSFIRSFFFILLTQLKYLYSEFLVVCCFGTHLMGGLCDKFPY